MPETSIVIRTHNEEKHLGNLLHAISEQDYKNYEVIVVDSGSTDKTVEIAKEFKTRLISIESRDFTFGHALNVGCEASRGKYLVFVSAHVLPVSNHWLSNMVAPLRDEKVAMVYGRQLGVEGSKFSEQRDFKRLFLDSPTNSNVPIEYSNNANSAIKKSLWESHPFDEYLFGLEDIDWARHMVEMGHLIRYESKAAIYHIHEEEWYQVFNRYRREAIAAVRIGLKQPPQSGISFFRLFQRLTDDIFSSFPNWSLKRLEEILRFRYYQWKGSRQGWFKDRGLDLERDKQELFFSEANQMVIIKDKHKASLERTSLPELKPGDILIKVDYVGVCRTDLEVYEGTLGYYRDGLAQYPIVPGHEFSGTIAKVGANNKYREWFKTGDRVVGECILSRGENGPRKEVGVINHNGAYAEFVVMPGDAIHKIPDGLDSKTAVLAEPLGVILRALRRVKSRLPEKASVAVIGAGPIGNLCAQTLAAEGYQVTVYDKNPERLKLLKDKVEAISVAIDHMEKFDMIIEITGVKDVLESALKQSRFDSTLLLLGFPYGKSDYNFEDLVGSEKVIIGSVGAERQDFPKALALLSKLDTEAFTQTILPLKDFKEAWELQKASKHIKILLKP
ncbi:MAG: glycosyltransferase [Candidatus Zambryskibacteria bacterium]|nr:glycosyltransferase [Candidatus Zambryskibacteria bacterium]